MSLRDDIEHVIRSWNAYDTARGHAPVIDFDCHPTDAAVEPATSRVAVLKQLSDLRRRAREGDGFVAVLDAHVAYLSAVMGEHLSLDDYVRATQGCPATGWPESHVRERGDIARKALADLGVEWSQDTDDQLADREGVLSPGDAGPAIRTAAAELEPAVRAATGSSAEYELTVETADVEEYWHFWLDGTGQEVRLRLNLRKAQFTEVRARQFALHEVLGHGLQSASLAAECKADDVAWVRLLSVHTPYQVMLEGLAQALPLLVTPDDKQLVARVRLDHYLQLVRAELHLAINAGHSVDECADHARRRVPWWTDESIGDELTDRGANPMLRSYLWSYPAGVDWFVALIDTSPDTARKVLHAAYRAPLAPAQLAAHWPAGPRIGGPGSAVRLRQPVLP